jgi:hypothetical protein
MLIVSSSSLPDADNQGRHGQRCCLAILVDVGNRMACRFRRIAPDAWELHGLRKHDRISIPAGAGSRLTPGARYSSARHDLRLLRASAYRWVLPFRRGHVYLHIRCVQVYIK